MANYGKVLVPLSFIPIAIGITLMNVGGGGGTEAAAIINLVIGVLLFAIGLARLVQGKERLILGQIVRPKAAARASAIWALFIFNVTPLVFPGSRILYYLEGPPFPMFILFTDLWTYDAMGYTWIPFVVIGFYVIWLLGLILSGKFPKTVNIIFNLILAVCFTFFFNFGLQFFLWTFFFDKSGLTLMEPWSSPGDNVFPTLAQPLAISLGLIFFSVYMITRMVQQLQISFSNLEARGGKQAVVFLMLIITYVAAIAPVYWGIMLCLENNSYMYPFINYVGFIFIAIIVLKALSNLITSVREFSKQKQGEGAISGGFNFGFSTAVFFALFIIAWSPVFLPLVDQGLNHKYNSIYNPDWSGWSGYKDALKDEGYIVMGIQSSISTVDQLDKTKQIVYVTAGPNVFYNPAGEIPFFLSALTTNFSLFICEDHGTAESLLFEMFIASFGATPITFIPKGVLRDNLTYWKDPTFPIIENFPSSPITAGVDKVCLSYASGFLGGEFLGALGWDILGSTSAQYSFIDVNNDGMFDQEVDKYTISDDITQVMESQEDNESSSVLGLAGDLIELGIPLGGYPQAVFTAKEIALNSPTPNGEGRYSSRAFVATDASWLNNELISVEDFDNLQFGLNVMEYLACGRDPSDVIIVFDEAHIRLESGAMEYTSAQTFGVTQGYVNWLSTNPFLSIVYPFFALTSLKNWIPAEQEKKKLQLRDLEEAERNKALLKFRTSSFFAQKINWYRKNHKFKQALLQLYRRLERTVNRMLGDAVDRSVPAVMSAIRREKGQYLSKDNYRRMELFFTTMFDLKSNKTNIKDEAEFEKLFMEMSWVNDSLGSR